MEEITHRVRAKSKGYTKHKDVAPAAPPEAKFPAKWRQNCLCLSMPPRKTYREEDYYQDYHQDCLATHRFVDILECKVECLGGKITYHIGQVAAPKGSESLLLGYTDETIDDTLVALILRYLLGDLLDLQEQLDTLDGSDRRLGHGRRHTAHHEVHQEALQILAPGAAATSFFTHLGPFLLLLGLSNKTNQFRIRVGELKG